MSGEVLIKGLFVLPEGIPIPFEYNPEIMRESRSVNYKKHSPAGFSHPIYHFESGDGNNITFTMMIRLYARILGQRIPYPVDTYKNQLLDLTYPVRNKTGGLASAPPVITFIFGTDIKKVKIKSVEVEKKEFTTLLGTKYGSISLSLFEVVKENHNRIQAKENTEPAAAKLARLASGNWGR